VKLLSEILEAKAFLDDTWNLNRALSSAGLSETLNRLGQDVDLEIHSFDVGSKVFSWTIPPSWNVTSGAISDSAGNVIWSTKDHPLAVWTNSIPVNKSISREDLLAHHVSYRKDYPTAVPYEYVYYSFKWGFSISAKAIEKLKDESFHVYVDAEHGNDPLQVGRFMLPGQSSATIVLTAHIDHPYQVSDGLSGAAGLLALIKRLGRRSRLFNYEFLFVPETIGTLAYFSRFPRSENQIAGLHVDMISHVGNMTFQKSLLGHSSLDHTAELAARTWRENIDFTNYRELPGNDEVILGGPGIGIPSSLVMRWPFGAYHTSLDNMDAFDVGSFEGAVDFIDLLLLNLEKSVGAVANYQGMLSLSAYGLFEKYGEGRLRRGFEIASSMMTGQHTLKEISKRSDLSPEELDILVEDLAKHNLVDVHS